MGWLDVDVDDGVEQRCGVAEVGGGGPPTGTRELPALGDMCMSDQLIKGVFVER